MFLFIFGHEIKDRLNKKARTTVGQVRHQTFGTGVQLVEHNEKSSFVDDGSFPVIDLSQFRILLSSGAATAYVQVVVGGLCYCVANSTHLGERHIE